MFCSNGPHPDFTIKYQVTLAHPPPFRPHTGKIGDGRDVRRGADGIVGKLGVGDCNVGRRETDKALSQNYLVVNGRAEARVVLEVGGPKRAAEIRVRRQEEEGRIPGIARDPEVDGIGFEGRSIRDGNSPGKKEERKEEKRGYFYKLF
ncbi:MAG: hypothetical protein BJ554DRAFT_5491 [Olpidium bornovanus]|uniref:Uncharacterized protein n=1 Tax=Olpidium bornovanus TaxID=278681 RepID=A0A8H7ZZL8_9FUNG|nr:MAG: hypothetical protein BJ554DRAFT_5491 [Olpidium bornovanus]